MKRHQRSWPAKIAVKLLIGLGMLVLGGIFGAALLLQALFVAQDSPELESIDDSEVVRGP